MRFVIFLCLLNALAVSLAKADDTVTVGLLTFPPALGNPYTGLNMPSTMPWDAVFDTVTRLDHDGTAQPWLATAWERIGPERWRFTLRDDVTFSNGEAFDANALTVAVTFLTSQEGRSTSLGSDLRSVTGAETAGPNQVDILTDGPNVLLPLYLARLFIPAPGHWQDLGAEAFAQDPVGSGPFQVDDWGTGAIAMSAFQQSWRAPKADAVVIRKIPDARSRLQGLLSDALDVAFNLNPEDRAEVEQAGHTFYVRLDPHHVYISFVTVVDSPVQNETVRIALNHAVDREAITEIIMDGATEPATQPAIRPAFGYDPSIEWWPYDPAQARQLLAEAGYPDGFDMAIALVPGNGGNAELAVQKVAQDLAAVGVNVTLKSITLAQLVSYLYEGGWDVPAFNMFGSGYDPLRTYRLKSCLWQTPYYCYPDTVPMIEAARNAPDLETRRERTQALMAYERQHPSTIPLYRRPGFDGVSKNLKGYDVVADVIPFHALELTE